MVTLEDSDGISFTKRVHISRRQIGRSVSGIDVWILVEVPSVLAIAMVKPQCRALAEQTLLKRALRDRSSEGYQRYATFSGLEAVRSWPQAQHHRIPQIRCSMELQTKVRYIFEYGHGH